MAWLTVIIGAVFAVSASLAIPSGCIFGYEGDTGPNHWGEKYEQCLGKHQSPINIHSDHVNRVVLPPLEMYGFEYTGGVATLTNNGHTAMMTINSGKRPAISGGPLKNALYEFDELHFHWGDSDSYGSEDEIDGRTYPMEMHIVFFKREYVNVTEALNHRDGLCVLAVFFELVSVHNDNFNGIGYTLRQIIKPNSTERFYHPPALFDLMPHDYSHYFTYNGSFTTPPCSEVVTWIDFKNPVKLSHDQFETFRALLNEKHHSISNNFRAVQPLGDRVVLYNVNFYDGILEDMSNEEKLLNDVQELVGNSAALVVEAMKLSNQSLDINNSSILWNKLFN